MTTTALLNIKTSSSLAPVQQQEHSSAAPRGNWSWSAKPVLPTAAVSEVHLGSLTLGGQMSARWAGCWQKHRWCHTKPVTFRDWAPQSCTHCRDAAGRFWHWNRSVCGKMPYIWPSRREEKTLSAGIKDTAPRSILNLLNLQPSSAWLDTMSNCWDGELGNWIGKNPKVLILRKTKKQQCWHLNTF